MKILIVLAVYLTAVFAQNTTVPCGAPCGCPQGQYSPYPGDPTKYIVCDYGRNQTMSCPPGLIWNQKIRACDWQGCGGDGGTVTGNCTGTPPPPITPSTQKPPVTTPSTRPPPVITPSTRPPPVITPSTCVGPCGCPQGQYSPHPDDCTKYIVCDFGRNQTMRCPAGLVWNQKIKTCSWPWLGCECGGNNTSPPVITPTVSPTTSTTTTTTTSTTTKPTTTSTTTTSTTTTPKPSTMTSTTTTARPPPISPPPGSCTGPCGCPQGQYSPHPSDPSKYIVCDFGRNTTMVCPSGLLWNQNMQTCAWAPCD